jgi:CheY-like chemotaxis protein
MNPRKILLAEDDVDDQVLFYDFLNHREDIVLMPVTENGVVLIDFLESIPNSDGLPDIIIVDQNMPKRNGLQTLRILKTMNRYASIPVVVYSTYTDKQLIEDGSEMGASAVVPKPFTKEGYNEMMDAFLKSIF